MKRITQTLLVLSLATASASFAATPSYPSSADETTSLSSEFPNMQTYADKHRNDAANRAPMTYPSGGRETTPLSQSFPNLQSYADQRRNDPAAVASAPTYPSSANETTSMSEEGLVPGSNSGSTNYAGVAQPSHN